MKTILITGASSGIGKSTARYFADKGWNVVATMRSPERENDLRQISNVCLLRLDVEDKMSIKETVSEAISRFNKIDVLLNNAGYGLTGLFEAATDDQIRRQFEVNVFGLMETTKAILPHFRATKDGVIINISSQAGILTFPNASLYHATKFAVEGFSEGLFYELASQNIKIKIIEPGVIKTDFYGRSMVSLVDESLTEYKEYLNFVLGKYREMKMIGDMASFSSPELVAEAIYKAATDGSNQLRYIVGDGAKSAIQMRQEIGDEEYVRRIAKLFLNG
jgi:short-subunit dehydrogenase